MTYRIGRHVFSGSQLASGLAIAAMAAILLSGCASSTVAQAVPAGAHGPAKTGTFPNLNIPPKQAAAQLTPDETKAEVAALRSAQQQNAARAATPSGQTDPALLRKLAETHAADALKEIQQ
jgi:hypothetical protein